MRFLRLLLIIYCIGLAKGASLFAAPILDRVYPMLTESQQNGRYVQELGKLAASPETQQEILDEMVAELEKIKTLPQAERETVFNELLRYYSSSNSKFKNSAIPWEKKTGFTINQLAQGEYKSAEVAARLLTGLSDYEHEVTLPLIRAIENQVATRFGRKPVVFLGRDFTSPYIYAIRHGVLNPHDLMNANVSRLVRDAALGGKLRELKAILAKAGITSEKAVKDGVVFLDSSMLGKIPNACLRALALDLSPEDTFRLLTQVELRYVRSGTKSGQTLAEAVRAVAQDGRITQAQLENLLSTNHRIEEFKFNVPPGYESEIGEQHHLLEHRPKPLIAIAGIEGHSATATLKVERPVKPADRIRALLGLRADLMIYDEAKPPQIFDDIDKAAKTGLEAMKKWQDGVTPEIQQAFTQTKVVQTGDPQYPYVLQKDGKTIRRLIRPVGEGNNVVAYLSEEGTVIKVIKKPENARKQILQAWAQRLLDRYDIKVARVTDFDPTGIWLEQEFIDSPSLEQLYGHGDEIPDSVRNEALDQWKKAKAIIEKEGIYLDLKAANYHIDRAGRIVNVDYTPRLNRSFYRYFRTDAGVPLSEEQYIDMFFRYDVKGKVSRAPKADQETVERYTKVITQRIGQKAAITTVEPLAIKASPYNSGTSIQLPSGETFVIIKEASEGSQSRVYQAKSKDGKLYALKVAKSLDADTIESFGKEKARAEKILAAKLPHAGVVDQGKGFVLKNWVEGLRADVWLKNWELAGQPMNTPEAMQLQLLLQKSAQAGVYVGNLDATNLIWNGKDWIIVDSGSIDTDEKPSRILKRYEEKMTRRWTRVTPGASCLFKALKALESGTLP